MMDELRKFTYDVYVKFLRFLQTKYRIIPLSEAPYTKPPYLILIHDVDLSLSGALSMAEIEHEMEIRSTYFILFSSELYNVFEASSNLRLMRIRELNHEVGLHYDLKLYRRYGELSLPLNLEVNALEMLLGQRVCSISMHQPEIENSNPFLDFPQLLCAQNQSLYDLYVSDSYRAWDSKYLGELLSLKHDRVKLSLHPGLWAEGERDRNTAISSILEHSSGERHHNYMEEMMNYWRRHPKVRAYEHDS